MFAVIGEWHLNDFHISQSVFGKQFLSHYLWVAIGISYHLWFWISLRRIHFEKMEILGNIKTYDWGTVGSRSKVAQLALKNDENFTKEFNETTPYAELW